MAKKNGLVDRIAQIRKETFFTTQHFTRQFCYDCMSVALNREFGFGADRLSRFMSALDAAYSEFAGIWNEDTKDVEYSKATMDAALKQIYGDKFQPREVRYGRS